MPIGENFEETLRLLRYAIDPFSHDWVSGEAVWADWNEDPVCILARVTFGRGTRKPASEQWSFPGLSISREPLDVAETAKALQSNLSIPLEIAGRRIELLNGQWDGHSPGFHFPSYLSVLPCYYLSARTRQTTAINQAAFESILREVNERVPATQVGGPNFVDVLAAIQDWYKLEKRPDLRDSRYGRLEVVLPPPPGTVTRVQRLQSGQLSVEIVPGLSPEALTVTLATNDGWEHVDESGNLDDGRFVFSGVPTHDFSLYVRKGTTLIAHCRTSPSLIAVDPAVVAVEGVAHLVRQGESETVEFKECPRDPNPHKWSAKYWRALVEVIASFGNTRGGALLLGVTDEGVIVGIDGQAHDDPEVALAGMRPELEGRLRKWVQDELTYKPQFDISHAAINGRVVTVVDVEGNPPGRVTSAVRGILVRRGSTTRIADSDECKRLCGRSPFP